MYNTTCPHLFLKIFVNFLTSTLLRLQNTTLLSKVRRRFFQIFQKTQTLNIQWKNKTQEGGEGSKTIIKGDFIYGWSHFNERQSCYQYDLEFCQNCVNYKVRKFYLSVSSKYKKDCIFCHTDPFVLQTQSQYLQKSTPSSQ